MSAPNPVERPLRHISVRVPWHDSDWAGKVCNSPRLNGACAKLKGISADKNDDAEQSVASQSLEVLSQAQWPCCVSERGAFMGPFQMDVTKRHALAEKSSKHYGHFRPTPQRYPPYSAGVVPFRWMMREHMDEYSSLYELDIREDREPELGYKTNWVHEAENQTNLLDGFASHLHKEHSLCFFYAKHVPFIEGTARILVGVGRVKNVGQLVEYDREGDGMRGMVWERPLQHSIRPKGQDGFLLPYQALLERAQADPDVQIERYTATIPDEHWDEFSYGSELVTHDGAIGALLAIEGALARMDSELGTSSIWQKEWLHTELLRLWKVRGPFPGLGSVLTAFGLSRGAFVSHALQSIAGENADPWPTVEKMFDNPAATLPKPLQTDLKELAPTWKALPKERKQFLRLLSRFELSQPQAAMFYDSGARNTNGLGGTDKEILDNPYRLYELSRHMPEGLPVLIVDRGIFPEDVVRLKHPLEAPSGLDSAVDLRRVRAFCVRELENAALSGHTLLSKNRIVEAIAGLSLRPACPVNGDIITARLKDMAPEVTSADVDGETAVQLERYKIIGDLIRKQVNGRLAGKRHVLNSKWPALLNQKFGPDNSEEEKRARLEKAAALKELGEARFSVLAGPAGAGKTSVLGVFCTQKEIQDTGLLLLAPTGKARVRMQELANSSGAKALTIAQFLNQNGRYDGGFGRYIMTGGPQETSFGTVIVDEASMLTEDMLGALFDALQGVKRFVFVGDPAQLPPIGAGRPFVDIIAKLRPADCESRFPRVTSGYAELTIERRQIGTDRPDLRFARWFSNTPPSAGEDDIFSGQDDALGRIQFVEWKTSDDFQLKLMDVLVKELSLSGVGDSRNFNAALGATVNGEYDYFNATRNGVPGAVKAAEKWQILSPLRGMPFGVGDINRQIHERFRADMIAFASKPWGRSIPKPLGAERIVYGDKVLNLRNHRRSVYPKVEGLGYLANGEIGMAVGQFAPNKSPGFLNVEFASQMGSTYGYSGRDFGDESSPILELAYALTVHKAQGSQFGLVIMVLPESHPILSRELVYTALTRHRDRVVVMHQGPRALLKVLTAPQRSETARRLTNLMQPCKMQEYRQAKGSIFLQQGLIHRTSTGLAVRSKSELIIADALSAAGIAFEYERPLTLGGSTRYPDFTIDDEISGRTVYWEHLGMLEREDYRKSWDAKLAWYRAQGVLPAIEGSGSHGTLVTTTESTAAGFDASQIQEVIRNHIQQ